PGARRGGEGRKTRAELSGSPRIVGSFAEEQAHGRSTMKLRNPGIRRTLILSALGLSCAVLLNRPGARLSAASPEEHNTAPLVLERNLDREVEPVLAAYIDEGLAEAARRPAALVLITMDTPGGLSDSMTDIIHHILDSPVPVAVYVAPA